MKGLILLMILSFTFLAHSSEMENFFKNKTKIENPFQLRDPFKPPQTKSDSGAKSKGYEKSGKDQYSFVQQVDLDQVNPMEIKLSGVLIGKERRAMAQVSGAKDVLILKEGMKIGAQSAEVKAILPGGIILVEKIINVYGEDEFLETVIPISR